MTHTLSKRILSTLLVMVMLVGLLPMAVSVSASDYLKMGDIGSVTAQSDELTVPLLGATVSVPVFTVTNPTECNVTIVTIGWQRYNAFDEVWQSYTKPTFTKGTYRLQIMVNSVCFSDRR